MADVDVCAVGDIADGGHQVVDAGGGFEVAVFLVDGQYFAIEDRCSHDDGPLADGEIADCQVTCPRHGARFDLRTGAALCLPAYRPIETFPVRIESGRIIVDV